VCEVCGVCVCVLCEFVLRFPGMCMCALAHTLLCMAEAKIEFS
jgi:hypothetical protein